MLIPFCLCKAGTLPATWYTLFTQDPGEYYIPSLSLSHNKITGPHVGSLDLKLR